MRSLATESTSQPRLTEERGDDVDGQGENMTPVGPTQEEDERDDGNSSYNGV